MDVLSSIFLGCFLAWAVAQVLSRIPRSGSTTHRQLPPGPPPLPIIGNLLKINDKQPHISFACLAKTYGPIMTIKLGQTTAVVVSSPSMAKEILQKHDLAFSNRANMDSSRALNHHQFSMTWLPNAEKWRRLRKICNSHIFSSQKLDAKHNLRRLKVEELVTEVRRSCEAGVAVDVGEVAFRTSLNLLSNTIFSMDLANPRSEIKGELKEIVTSIMEWTAKPNLVDYFPLLRKIDPQGIRRRMTIDLDKLMKLFDQIINQRLELKEVRGSSSSIDVLDSLLGISEDQSDDQIDLTHIKHLLLDLFVAGTSTNASTLEWIMAELLRNPNTLAKARAELHQTVGKGKVVEESDIDRLPYLHAILKETFRLHPPGPLLIPRMAATDVEVSGFTVPKGTRVMVNTWAIGRDPGVWENPNSFVPERFLGSQMDVRGRDFELLPFGAGRRMCPGFPMAMRMVPVMLGSLLNLFGWELEGGLAPEDMDMEEKFGLSLDRARPLRALPLSI